MAHKKAGGSTSNLRDSQGQRLGVKLYAGEKARTGNIIVRQRGSKIRPGINVSIAKDDSLFAIADGIVKYTTRRVTTFTGKIKHVKFANIVSAK